METCANTTRALCDAMRCVMRPPDDSGSRNTTGTLLIDNTKQHLAGILYSKRLFCLHYLYSYCIS